MHPRGTVQGVEHVFETPVASVPANGGAQAMIQNLNNDIVLQLGNVAESLRQENAIVHQDLMWVMCIAIPLMINKVIWSEEFTEGMLKVLEHVMRYVKFLVFAYHVDLLYCSVRDLYLASYNAANSRCSSSRSRFRRSSSLLNVFMKEWIRTVGRPISGGNTASDLYKRLKGV
ncbi:hypothetical protein Tco_0332070 [Tanacetum coccineum]